MGKIREDLIPHRDKEAEKQLKALIKKIEKLMDKPKNQATVEELLKKAAEYVKVPDRVLDLTVIEQYYSWTDLDGLVGELTVEVPKLSDISKEDFVALAQYISDVLAQTSKTRKITDFEYLEDYYTRFFELNYPEIKDFDIFEQIVGAYLDKTPLEEVVNKVYPNQ